MYSDLHRPALRPDSLQRALAPDGWRVEVLESVESTNVLLSARALDDEPAGLVLVAEHQRAGRGRLDRSWASPPRAGLTLSVLLRPTGDPAWMPLVGGLAVVTALAEVAGTTAQLKWPNDVLVDGRKVCGVLAVSPAPGAVVLGIGLNVTTRLDELPDERASSLQLAGATTTDRGILLRAVLRSLRRLLDDEPAQVRAAYRESCSTIGARVRLDLPGDAVVTGTGQAVDDAGRLVVDGTAYAAGDVVHLR